MASLNCCRNSLRMARPSSTRSAISRPSTPCLQLRLASPCLKASAGFPCAVPRIVSLARPRAARSQAVSAHATQDEDMMEMELEVSIKGMVCDGCSSRVEEVLKKAEGVSKVEVSLDKGMATVDVRVPSQLEAFAMLPRLVESVRALGFEAEPYIDGL